MLKKFLQRKYDLLAISKIMNNAVIGYDTRFDLPTEFKLQEFVATSSLSRWEKRKIRNAIAYNVNFAVVAVVAKYLAKYNKC